MIIKYLSPLESQKIAAGEVVERPSNIVKELIENALDAKATKIELEVQDGGKRLIKIIDNGIGMEPEDARIAFLRHTTSKLTSFDDLLHIETFGFRGEALASICSVSRVTLITRHISQNSGILLKIEEGKIKEESIIGSSIGTTIIIEDLFYNLPARQKFLKATSTEFNQILQLFKAFCFSRIDCYFSINHNGTVIYVCPIVKKREERVAQLFDISLSKQLIPFVVNQNEDVIFSGVMTGPSYSRYDRSGIYIFINNRWVKNYSIIQAIIKGYTNVLPHGKYPFVIGNLILNSHEIDPNVHPKKEEVALLHSRKVEVMVSDIIKKTLEQNVSVTLGFADSFKKSFVSPNNWINKNSFISQKIESNMSDSVKDLYFDIFHDQKNETYKEIDKSLVKTQSFIEKNDIKAQLQTPFINEIKEQSSLTSLTYLAQLHMTYLMFEHQDGLLLIDQHAAHERIIYERIGDNFVVQDSINLLFPEFINCRSEDMKIMVSYFSLFAHYGIVCEQYSENQCIVRSKSVFTQSINIEELMRQILGWITDYGKADTIDIQKYVNEKMRAQIACKAAVKAGDSMTHEKVHALLKDLEMIDNRFSCPHGRPTMWILSHYEIEKRFKRV